MLTFSILIVVGALCSHRILIIWHYIFKNLLCKNGILLNDASLHFWFYMDFSVRAFLHEQKIIFSWFLCPKNLEALGTWIRQTVFWCKLQRMLRAPWVAEMWVLGCTGFSVSVFQDSVCSLHPSLILFRHCGLRASTHSIRTLFNFGLCYFVPISLQIHQDGNIGLWLIPPVDHERLVSPCNGRLIWSYMSSLLNRKIGIGIPSPNSFWWHSSWCSPDQYTSSEIRGCHVRGKFLKKTRL